MKLLIAGSRRLFDLDLVGNLIKMHGLKPTQIIGGGAIGIDLCGQIYAMNNDIPFDANPADWATGGINAGFQRNARMGEKADLMLLIWDGKSNGSKHMYWWAKNNGLPFYEVVIDAPPTHTPEQQRRMLVNLLKKMNERNGGI